MRLYSFRVILTHYLLKLASAKDRGSVPPKSTLGRRGSRCAEF